MATLLSDNFDRANSTTVVGAPQIGPTPTVPTGTGGISSNELYAPVSPANIIWNLGTTDVEMTATCTGLMSSQSVGFILGYAGTLLYWLLTIKTTGIELYRQESAGFVSRDLWTGTLPVSPAVVKVHHKDSIIRVWLEGQLIIRHNISDIPITTTSHGFRITSSGPKVSTVLGADAADMTESTLTGAIPDEPAIELDSLVADAGFAYRGRDTKLQDAAAGA